MKKVRIERYGDSVGIEFEASLHFTVWTVSAETPHGKRFAATGTHVVKLPGDGCRLPYRPDWNEVYKELKSTVNFGIVDCPSDCEYCKGRRLTVTEPKSRLDLLYGENYRLEYGWIETDEDETEPAK